MACQVHFSRVRSQDAGGQRSPTVAKLHRATKRNVINSETAVLTRACQHATEYLEGVDSRPVATTSDLAELRRRLNVELGASGTLAGTVIDELVAAIAGGSLAPPVDASSLG